MQSEEDFRRAIENSPTAWVTDSSGNKKPLTGKEVRESNLNSVIKTEGSTPIYLTDQGWSTSIKDPYLRAGKEAEIAASLQTPKIKIENGGVKLQGTSEVLASPLATQIKDQMQSLVGSDLDDPEVQNAVNSFNSELENSIKNWVFEESFGWTPEEFADYQYAIQSVSGTNPMSSTNKIKGTDRYGDIQMKTPQEWVDYYREAYNTDERTDAYLSSLEADSPYARTMAVILNGGGEKPIYGWDTKERIDQMFGRINNEWSRLYKGLVKNLTINGDGRRVANLLDGLGLEWQDVIADEISTDDNVEKLRYDKNKKEIEGKSWNELSAEQKGFLLKVAVSREPASSTADDRERYYFQDGPFAAKEGTPMRDTSEMASGDEEVSRRAISSILENSGYDRYKDVERDFSKLVYADEEDTKEEERLAKNAIWSENEQMIGAPIGVITRFLTENAMLRALTGFSMASISDTLGSKLVNAVGKIGIAPTSRAGKSALTFAANLAGTIPEDVVQISVDNILTDNAEENSKLLSPDQMSENFKDNLIFLSLFNGARAGWSAVKKAKILKQLANQADLDTKIDIGATGTEAYEAAKVYDDGGYIETDGSRVFKVDPDGAREELKNTTPEQANIIIRQMEEGGTAKTATDRDVTPEIDTSKIGKNTDGVSSTVDDTAKVVDDGRVKVEVDTPDGKKVVDVPDYNFKSYEDATSSKIKVEPTMASLNRFMSRAKRAIMRDARTSLFDEFKVKFGDVTSDDFDWIFYNSRKGLTPDQIVGTYNEKTGKLTDQNMIDAAKWWANHPIIKKLRMSSREGLGETGDKNILGYLPHTNYDPLVLPFEEAKTGQLWQTFTGKSMVKDGKYVGYGGPLEGRFRTYVSNMLWDSRAREVAAAKLIEEAQMEGKNLTPDEAMKMAEGWREIDDGVAKSKSSKDYEKAATADGDSGMDDFKAAAKATEEEAPNSGVSASINKNFSELYIGSGRGKVEQPKGVGNLSYSIDTQADTMRKIKVNGVSLYDAGGADMVYYAQNAAEVVNRWVMEGADPAAFRNILTEYLVSHSKRSAKYAESIADNWINRIAKESGGNITKGSAIKTLSKAMRSEGFNRVRRWVTLADYKQFNKNTTKFIDNFLYRHMQMESIANNKNIIEKMSDGILNLRYDALFYGNFKNALLQVSELSRLFSVFKWGDVGSMMKRMATDADFRARVNMYTESVAPRTSMVESLVYDKYSQAADAMEVGEDGVRFSKLKESKKTIDDIALAPINTAEAVKNRTMVAALVAEADRLKLSGEEALMWIRQRFERVALAQNEMGKIGLSTNPFTKPMLFLQSFQMRELGMHYYNIFDPIDLKTGKSMTSKKAVNAVKYLIKVLGTKLGITFVLARLGYSAAQTMGLDPFGVANNYDRLSDDEKTWIDQQISGGVLTPLFAGGMTSLISDMYFMAREAYEDANRKTVSEDAEANLNKGVGGGADWSAVFNLDNLLGLVGDFTPGSVLANRIGQMNDMRDKGWAVSSSGNKMYTAPDDALNTILGYMFGRGATQNALQYNQTYGNNIPQTLGRFFNQMAGGGSVFDPIDTQNYSDWFDGSENDAQQFEKGRRWFQSERDRILDAYEESLRENIGGDLEEAEAKNNMNQQLDELYEKLTRFVNAYEKENGSITGNMVKRIVNLLNTDRESINDTTNESSTGGIEDWNKAMERYAQLGLPAVGYYSGPQTDRPGTSINEEEKELKYKGSPQWQVSSKAKYDLRSEAVAVLDAGDAMLEDIRKSYKDQISDAYDKEDYTTLKKIQKEYLTAFDKVVGPILATYGRGILSDGDVVEKLREMLSTNSGNNADFVPRDDWSKGTNGRYISSKKNPNAGLDLKKWLKERYSSDTFKTPTVRSYSTAQEDIDAIKRLNDSGQSDMARARALELKVRIDNQKRSLGKDDYQWLLDFLNNGGA